MAMRVCRDCPAIIPTTAYKGRCSSCSRQADRARGTKTERGYGPEFVAERKAWRPGRTDQPWEGARLTSAADVDEVLAALERLRGADGSLATLRTTVRDVFADIAEPRAGSPADLGRFLAGIEEIRAWALSTFNLSEGQLTSYLDTAWARLNESSNLGSSAAQAGLTAGHVLTGMAIAMFTLFFFLFDGPAIWAWIVRLFPRSSRANVVSGGRIAWGQLQAFTRATIDQIPE